MELEDINEKEDSLLDSLVGGDWGDSRECLLELEAETEGIIHIHKQDFHSFFSPPMDFPSVLKLSNLKKERKIFSFFSSTLIGRLLVYFCKVESIFASVH